MSPPASPNVPTPNPGILDIAPYVPGESTLPGGVKPIKLSSNETPLGPSPKAIEAYLSEAKTLALYPDGASTALRDAIGRVYGLNPAHIVCGSGSDEILNLIANAYLGVGDEGIFTAHGFLVYKIVIMGNGATPVVAPETNFTTDVDAILACVTDRTKVVFVANPNNPTGTYIPFDEMRRLRAGLPGHVLLVIDAAYSEYVRRNDYEAGLELVATTQNTVMTRTFSKIHGLAALRLGWAYCPAPIADVLNRIRGPFNVSQPSISAGIAAIEDGAHQEKAIAHNDQWLPWLTGEIERAGFRVTPSVGNFILVHLPDHPGRDASAADAALKARGIIVRRMGGYGLPNALRITIGSADENRAVASAFAAFAASIVPKEQG